MDDQTAPESPDRYDEEPEGVDVRVTGQRHVKPRVLLEWTGPSRVHVQREHNFFVTLFIAAVAAGFILVLIKEYVLMLVVFALAFTVYAANKHEPKLVTYQITSTAIIIDGQRFSYDELTSFWFEEEGGQVVLKVARPTSAVHYVDLVINPESRDAIEDELLEYLPYERVDEGRLIGFIRRLIFPVSHPLESRGSAESEPSETQVESSEEEQLSDETPSPENA